MEKFLRKHFVSQQKLKLEEACDTDSRLSLYGLLQHESDFTMSAHLKLNIPKVLSQTITMFRTGCHNLPISTGRLTNPITETNERKCTLCPNLIGDEKHFIFHCPAGDPVLRRCIIHNSADQLGLTNCIGATIGPLDQNDLLKHILTPTDVSESVSLGKCIMAAKEIFKMD